ncbi:hypothetical protein J437_LFUL001653 [Ladona fulva]|uniref:MD-2-related lipid-recognition domain-containing protein n=1 Tax=Ladona fulva TaxID=123851 RepID=A0A8K0K2H1_LADFU|nr:hypothetical protein J437_LFUL001653 [Ladona fulva]
MRTLSRSCFRTSLAFYIVLLLVVRTASAGFLSKRKVRIKTIKFADCGTSKDPVKISDLFVATSVSPKGDGDINNDLGGDLVVAGKAFSKMELKPPIRAEVHMQRRMLGIWMRVFCIRQFGSCDFEDLCSLAPSNGYCPPILEEHDVPCNCPILPGNYSLPDAQFRVDGTRWAGVMAGTYRGSVRFKSGDKQLACIAANFELE